jgi:pimeloyl-ACP methyl ester carboxylesterase
LVSYRKYGQAPRRVCVIHGGPGAPGSLAPLAEELSKHAGILEPFQTAGSIKGQLDELDDIIEEAADKPVILIGHSWGAWLSLLYTASFPGKVIKLVLAGSGPLTEDYVSQVSATRIKRLSEAEKTRLRELEQMLTDPYVTVKARLMREYSVLMYKTDSYDPLPFQDSCIAYQPEILLSVWSEAAEIRRNGRLLAQADAITCPVVIIHGDYDPHPWQGVVNPLKGRIRDVTCIRLKHCGHEPWHEKQARDKFFNFLKRELMI